MSTLSVKEIRDVQIFDNTVIDAAYDVANGGYSVANVAFNFANGVSTNTTAAFAKANAALANTSGTFAGNLGVAGSVTATGSFVAGSARIIPSTGGLFFDVTGINNDIVANGRTAAITAGWGSLRVHQNATLPALKLVGDTSQTANYMEVESSTGTTLYSISANGNVGIGTSSPSGKLHVTQTTSGTNGLLVNMPTGAETTASGIRVFGYSPAIELMDKDSVQNWFMGIDDNDGNKLVFARGYGPGQGIAPAITVTPSDNVGIGTSSPNYRLVSRVTSSTPALYLLTSAAGGGSYVDMIASTYDGGWTNGAPATVRFIDDGAFSAHIAFRTKTTGASGNADVERMRIDSSGRVTTPFQPVFAASGSTTQSWSGSANYQTLQLNLQYVSNNSRGSGYNTSTYRFTAPVAGMYMFFGKITQTGTATGPSLFLFVNGNIANIYEMTIGYSVAYMSTSGLAPWYMNAGDYAELRVNNNNSVSQSLDLSRCNFVGWLLG